MGALGMIAACETWIEVAGAGLPVIGGATRIRQLEATESIGLRGIHFEVNEEPYGPTWAVETARVLLYRPLPYGAVKPTDEGVEALLAEAARDKDVRAALDRARRESPAALLHLYNTLIE